MRAALSILGLVIVLTIVLLNAKHQMKALAPAAPAASLAAPSDGSAPTVNRATPDAVRAQVQSSMEQAASAASANQP